MGPAQNEVDNLQNFHGLMTTAPCMFELFGLLERAARSNASILVRGETGTGKELVAKAIHALSPRSRNPFRAVNCATFTPELLSSELFGHVKGAFTGAVGSRSGLFRLADRGTVFLDEVAEIPLEIQARLLRVLQERTFVPVGGSEPVEVDVRLVSATHRALRREVEERRFREDLMYRIRVVPIFLPPLRERRGDVEALTWHFIREFNDEGYRHVERVDAGAWRALLSYPWPGNVRELRNVLEYAFVVGEGETLMAGDLPPELRGEEPPSYSAPPAAMDLEARERRRLLDALDAAGGRRGEAAEALGISRSTLWRRLRELGIQR